MEQGASKAGQSTGFREIPAWWVPQERTADRVRIGGIMMKRILRSISLPFVPAVFFIGIDQNIPAYLDAGTGSIILQAVLGALVGAAVAVKLFWGQIKSFFGRLFSRSKHSDEPQDEPQ
jgi:hypothetical protein